MSRSAVFIALLIGFVLETEVTAQAAERLGIGHTVSPQDFAAWDIDVRGDGVGLPEGRGSVDARA